MSNSTTKKELRRLTERLQTLERSLRDMQKALDLSVRIDRSMAARRSIAVFFGMPLACTAFVFLTFLIHKFNGNGLYIGMGCAFLCWLIVRPAIRPFDNPLPELEEQVERLIRARERTKDKLQEFLDEHEAKPRRASVAVEQASEAA